MRNLALILALLLAACRQESREALLAEAGKHLQDGNPRGAVVIYKTCLERFPDDPGTRFALAKAYLDIGKPEQAETELRKLANGSGAPADLQVYLGRAKLAKQAPAEARKAFQAQLAAFPDSASAWEGLGFTELQADAPAKAVEAFERSLALNPGLADARCALVEILMRENDFEQASRQLDQLFEHHPAHHAGMLLLARLEIARDNPEAAAATYAAIMAKHPRDILARSQHALIRLLSANETAPAEEAATKLIATAPKRPEGYRLRGLLELRRGEYAQAINSFQMALKQSPDPASNVLMAEAYLGNGNPEMAISELCLVLDQRPDDAKARWLLATINLRLNRMDEAIAELEKLLQHHPEDTQAQRLIGDTMLSQGALDKSLSVFTALEQKQGATQDTLVRKGIILARQGRTAEAETTLRQAVALDQTALEARVMLATFLKQQGRFDEAEASLDLDNSNPEQKALAYNAQAKLRFQQGRFAETEALLQKAREMAPNMGMTYYNLATLDFKEGRPEKAAYWYRTLLERHPDDVPARLNLASALECHGKNAEAEEQLRVAAATKQLKPMLLLADFYSRNGQTSQALEAIAVCQAVHKDSVPASVLTFRLLLQANDKARAQAELQHLERLDKKRAFSESFTAALKAGAWPEAEILAKKSIEEGPHNAENYLPMARLLEAKGDAVAAQEIIRRGLEADMTNAKARIALAMQLHNAGKNQQALEQLDTLLKPGAPQALAYVSRGIVLQALGENDKAIADYENALRHQGQNLTALNNLALLYADRPSQAPQALDLAWAAYNLDRNAPAVLDTLGYALLKNNHVANAQVILKRALQLSPDDEAIAKHLQLAKTDKQ
ncbi:TPR domain protein [Desulfovibrio sp. DV]|uniref:XrtA/PEP-CTERM system TPR-repeat protein PrsT n=1 Tax=Desulfovibrio sp. DV TaxID=1844708 RepID=UPI00094BB0CC|nr:XrtA/PEP-CTERM system TPR-repeat protein PrsT [Desulfovibrio sp. DV]OLN29432.1 TPR domain protein [Desulfovibrio sp. DV]